MAETHSPLQLMLRNLGKHFSFSDEDTAALLGLPFKLRTVEASAYLVREGELLESCPVLGAGFAFRQKLTGDGRRQIMALHVPGEALDFAHLFLDVADHSVQMLTRGEVALVPRKPLQDLAMARPAVAAAILVNTLIEASIYREWVLNVGRRDALARMAHLLCEFAVRMNAQGLAGADGYDLPITQEQFADVLGLTPVHVNRTLKVLESQGLIRRNKRSISFPDWGRLCDVGDFNQRYLHLGGELEGEGSRVQVVR